MAIEHEHEHEHEHGREHERHVSLTAIHASAGALLVLWLLSWGLSYAPLGQAGLPVALTIAGVKALLVALVFMELAVERFSVQATTLAACALVAVLVVLTVLDVETRGQPPLMPSPIDRRAP